MMFELLVLSMLSIFSVLSIRCMQKKKETIEHLREDCIRVHKHIG